MLPYGGKRKEYTYIHTHTHPTLPQAVSVFHFTIKCLKYYVLYVTILPPFIPLCYCKLNFYLSVCDSDHFTVTSLRENNALPPPTSFPSSSSFNLCSQQENMVDGCSSLGHPPLPVFPTLFHLISLLATALTHRENSL